MNRSKRQFQLFLVAVALPAVLLSAFAFRFLRQETELAQQRAIVERNNAIEGVRRELTARLDAIKLEEMNRRLREPSNSERPANSAIVFVTSWNREGLVLPWSRGSKTVYPAGDLISMLDSGEKAEFQAMNPVGAVEAYRRALRVARDPQETCDVRLRMARVLIKAKMEADALKIYRDMLTTCDSTLDESSVPFALYAADRLVELKLDIASARNYLVREALSTRSRPLEEANMVRLLLQNLEGDSVESARRAIVKQIDAIQQTTAFSVEFAKELATELGRVRKLDEKWFAYGPEPWLLTTIPETSTSEPLFFAISSSRVAPNGVRLITQHTAESAPLGPEFTNVEMEFFPPRSFTGGRVPATVYAIGLASILGLTVLAGYLLLYRVRRDMQITELRSQFVASVSHELRTPLTAIRMFAETLALGRAGNEQSRSEYLETIVNESERLARLVDNVLDFSKIEQGRKIYHMKPTALADVIHSAARTMQYPLTQQGFNLDISVDENVPVLPADPDAMEQAILNLLSNAMKYSGDARSVELRLERERQAAAIKVVDRGIGISSADLQHIFDKFYRVRSNQTDLITGTGLGLTLVKHIAESHGGQVEVQSAVGAGSTFTIRIPLTLAEVSS